jgi:hypothetical protein
MAYTLSWTSPGLPYIQKQNSITVPTAGTVSNAASISLTGRGAPNYGVVQQQNLLKLLENFAGPSSPSYPTVGQLWYDTDAKVLKLCTDTPTATSTDTIWKGMSFVQVGSTAPTSPAIGDLWFNVTGTNSGIMYVYTGLGRFPEQTWTSTGYYPTAVSTTLAVKNNYDSFTNMNPGEGYLHGFSAGVSADVDGSVLINGTAVTIPRGILYSSYPVSNGILVYSANGFSIGAGTVNVVIAYELADGTWLYDNNAGFVTFTPDNTMYAIGLATVTSVDPATSGSTSYGLSSTTVWPSGISLSKIHQFSESSIANGKIGGWEQLYPTPNVVGGRDEYNYIFDMVYSFIGSPTLEGGAGGANAIGKNITYLSPLKSLTASLETVASTITDSNVFVNGAYGDLTVQPTSYDWDRLLAAARYALARLELPSSLVSSISNTPFVSDKQAVDTTINLPSARYANNTLSTATMLRTYQETANALQSALQNRYVLKGMLGASGTNTTFNSEVSVVQQAAFNAAVTGSQLASSVTHGLSFRFNVLNPEAKNFFTAGQAIEILLAHSGTSTAADTALRNLLSSYGRFRLTMDELFVMTPSTTPSLSVEPVSGGFESLSTSSTTLFSISVGTAAITVRGLISSASNLPYVQLFVDVTAGGLTTGTLNVTWNTIVDNTQYGSPATYVFPRPLTYTATDKLGSSIFV